VREPRNVTIQPNLAAWLQAYPNGLLRERLIFSMSRSVWISTQHSVEDYRKMEVAKDQLGIAALIRLRLTERYVTPVVRPRMECLPPTDPTSRTSGSERSGGSTSGFALAAFACLLIETIQCFREGLRDTKPKGVGLQVFKNYFATEGARLENLAGRATSTASGIHVAARAV
jgi:hypothetical protein